MPERHVELIESVVAFDGYFKVVRHRLRHSLFTGGMGPELTREVFERGHAAAVLPYDCDRDEVVLIEQFRIGACGVDDDPWLLETVAGIIETGEPVRDVVRREALEEAGLELLDLLPVARYFASPGGTTETVELFVARVDSSQAGGLFGLAEEGEDIKVHVVAFDRAMAWLRDGKIKVATTLIALQWLALNRDRLRQRWTTASSKA